MQSSNHPSANRPSANRPATLTVRIIRDTSNKDGWIIRDLADSKAGFIKNLDEHIAQLSAGQLWEANLIDERDTYLIISLSSMIRA